MSKAEELGIKAAWTAPLVFLPGPSGILGKLAFNTAKLFGVGAVWGDVIPGPIAKSGNEVIRWQHQRGLADSNTINYATIVVSRGLVVQYNYTLVDWSPVMFEVPNCLP